MKKSVLDLFFIDGHNETGPDSAEAIIDHLRHTTGRYSNICLMKVLEGTVAHQQDIDYLSQWPEDLHFLGNKISLFWKKIRLLFRSYQPKIRLIQKRIMKASKRTNMYRRAYKPSFLQAVNSSDPFRFSSSHIKLYGQFLRLFNKLTLDYNQLLDIFRFSSSFNFSQHTLRPFWQHFRLHYTSDVSFAKFRSLFKLAGCRYVDRRCGFDNSPTIKQQRINFAFKLLKNLDDPTNNVLFFDVSSVSDSSFKKRVWNSPLRPNRHTSSFAYNLTHLLLITDARGHFCGQFVKGSMSSGLIQTFISSSLKKFQQEFVNTRFTIVLDNAAMHRTRSMKNFVIQNKVTLLFIPVKNPFLNLAEFVFRFLKSPLKSRQTLK